MAACICLSIQAASRLQQLLAAQSRNASHEQVGHECPSRVKAVINKAAAMYIAAARNLTLNSIGDALHILRQSHQRDSDAAELGAEDLLSFELTACSLKSLQGLQAYSSLISLSLTADRLLDLQAPVVSRQYLRLHCTAAIP